MFWGFFGRGTRFRSQNLHKSKVWVRYEGGQVGFPKENSENTNITDMSPIREKVIWESFLSINMMFP